jgi:multimeric flavodoxin WrbA
LKECSGLERVVSEGIGLAGLSISDCMHCGWCRREQTAERLCCIVDDALPILEKIRRCDVLILATPVCFAGLSGTMACLIDRTRCLLTGRRWPMALKGKIGVALAVAWNGSAGIQSTLESLYNAFFIHEMWTPSAHPGNAVPGVAGAEGRE